MTSCRALYSGYTVGSDLSEKASNCPPPISGNWESRRKLEFVAKIMSVFRRNHDFAQLHAKMKRHMNILPITYHPVAKTNIKDTT